MHAPTVDGMSAIQIRDVPPELHRELRLRATRSGRSLSEYALAVLARDAQTPSLEELLERARLRGPVDLGDSTLDVLHAERDAR
jgi:plasmid stability protein